MHKPVVLVLDRDKRHVDGVAIALAGRFDVRQAKSGREAAQLAAQLRPLVVTIGLKGQAQGIEPAKEIRGTVGRGTLLIGHGKFPYGHKGRSLPKDKLCAEFQLDDFVPRDLGGEDVGKIVWSHVAAAIRSVPRPAGKPTQSTEETWTELMTSDASVDGFRKMLTKPILPVTELEDDKEASWTDLMTAPLGQTFKRLFGGKKKD